MKNNFITDIHNMVFNNKVTNKYFDDLQNIYNIYSINDEAYLVLIDSIDVYEIFEIAVHPLFRRKGYASELINQIPNDKDIFLEVNETNSAAISFYLKNGFKIISKRKNYYGKNSAIIMKRNKN
ncbi:GNAT family N-acetyltransferase [Caviibacter abscessus]|uniref:GNAT family N-acetyltransferase n=1 Tax=Caviibacter abscessus TaxID=1766719 RepID=UPI000829EBE1|nr:GNAT family N-acetyltransferase [Caviibacter abscessus]